MRSTASSAAAPAPSQHLDPRRPRPAAARRGRALPEGRGEPPAEIVITEDEARFAVDVRAGQKTGFFLDQRENRRAIRRHAAGAAVLNVFS